MEVSELVEDLMAYVPMPPSGTRSWLPEACLNYQPGAIDAFANVSAVRATADTVARLSADAARFFGSLGREHFLWFLGPRSTPGDVRESLAALGAVAVGQGAGMRLDHEPPPQPNVTIRQVKTPDELLTYRQIGAATEVSGDAAGNSQADLRASNTAAWQDYTSYAGRRLNFLALIDGEPLSAAGLLLTDRGVAVLSGAATLPAARGQGLYRALVHARWAAAERLQAGPLAVQASVMSRPILAAIGFEQLVELTILRQPTTS